MFGRIGIGELILILAIALVIFGPAKLPEIGRVIGEAIQNFKKASERLADPVGGKSAGGESPRDRAARGEEAGTTAAKDGAAVDGGKTQASGPA